MSNKLILTLVFFLATSVPAQAALSEAYFSLIPDASTNQRNENIRFLQEAGGVGDYFKLVKAQGLLKQKQFQSAIALAQTVQTPILVFWKNVVMAESLLAQDKARDAVQHLTEFPKQPKYLLSFDEGIYNQLVKRALLVGALTQGIGTQERNENIHSLQAWFPGDEDIKNILSIGTTS